MSETNGLCDRCGKAIPHFSFDPTGGMTAGWYLTTGGWGKFANPGERAVCDECMWSDPRYIAVYGIVKRGIE